MEARTRLSTRGQVVIPKSLRDAYRWEVGQELEVVDTGEGVLLKAGPARKAAAWDDVVGCLSHLAEGRPAASDDDMHAAVRAMAAQRDRRSRGG